jgi:hypothetical protein
MAVTTHSHFSIEIRRRDPATAFSEDVWLRFTGRWGEVPFSVDTFDAYATADAVKLVAPLKSRYWDTRWIRVEDPKGSVHGLEAHSEE